MIKLTRPTLAAGLLLLLFLPACTLRARTLSPTMVGRTTPTQANFVPPTPEITAAASPGAAQANPTAPAVAEPTAPVVLIPDQTAFIMAQGVNLRTGPGTLFERLGLLDEGTKITVTGKARGNDWLYVNTGDRQGWVSVLFTSLMDPAKLATVPLQSTGDALVIEGKVEQSDGMPLAGIEFAAFQGNEDAKPPDTRAHSLADGSFFLYLPHGSSGTWRVSLTAVDCKSPIVDANCNYLGAFMPRFTDVTLPAQKVVEFQYTK